MFTTPASSCPVCVNGVIFSHTALRFDIDSSLEVFLFANKLYFKIRAPKDIITVFFIAISKLENLGNGLLNIIFSKIREEMAAIP